MNYISDTSAYPQLSAPVESNNGEYPKDSPLIHGLCVYLLENLDGDFNRVRGDPSLADSAH
jgi:hypothetical protein